MPFISITRLRVRSWRFLPSLFVYALRSAQEAAGAEGNLTAKILNDRPPDVLDDDELGPRERDEGVAGAHRVTPPDARRQRVIK